MTLQHKIKNKNKQKSGLLLLVLLTFSLFIRLALASEMFTYQMKYQPAAQVIDAIKPHLNAQTVVTAHGNQLFIQATNEEYQKIQSMLALLDKKPAEYFVEVKLINRKLDTWEMQQTAISVTSQSTDAKVTYYENSGGSQGEKRFSLRLSEGYQGFVNTGESFVTNQLVERYGSFIPKSSIKKVTSGFYVTVNDIDSNQVRIAVSTQASSRESPTPQNINSTSTVNYINGQKNQWLLLATINEEETQHNVQRYSNNSSSSGKRWYYIRIKDITD